MASVATIRKRRNRLTLRFQEFSIRGTLWMSAAFSIGITLAIIVVVFGEAYRFFQSPEVSLSEFFGTLSWSPTADSLDFGVWPLICGTVLVSVIAMLFAIPLGLITAVFLSEYAPRKVRAVVKPTLEILAGIPTVVYGFLAFYFITPTLNAAHDLAALPFGGTILGKDGFNTANTASAGIAVGILCLPIITSLTEDALRAVPRNLREGAYGLGATRLDVSLRVVFPAALSGIVSAILLAIARTIGETMIVAMAAGASPRLTADPRDEVQTMTGYMVQIVHGEANSSFGVAYLSVFAVAAVLFAMTFVLTLLGHRIRVRFREAYQ